MAYIWINPVTESMYEPKVLAEFLKKHGYEQIKTTGDWLNIVKEKYRIAASKATGPVIDMRCPKTKEVLDQSGVTSDVYIPTIEPILIHCARELSERGDLQEEEKVITTPCQALADMGNALNLPKTRFVPWNQFLQSLHDRQRSGVSTANITIQKSPKESPIPPGFFEGLELKTTSVTGEDDIFKYLQKHLRKDVSNNIQLVEVLFCKEGCHNGDGIKPTDGMCER